MKKRRRVPLRIALSMLAGYARSRIIAQIKAVAFIIVYLVIFQVLILRVPLSNSIMTAGGIALVIFGLAFFLEGLVLGFMPLGERVGAKLPSRTNIFVVALFGLVLGFGTTLAEPAVSALRTAGSILKAWESPLLYMVLEKYTEWLVLAIGTGVGVAVSIGTLRFYYNISIKPFILILTPLLLIISVYFSFDKNLSGIMGLAWDCGAVTTGAVTVPLVLALGLDVSRTAGKGKGTASGFGVVLLASYLPVLSVMILGYIINFRAPEPTTETNFFSPGKRDNALAIFENDTILLQHAFIKGSETGRRAFFDNEDDYHKVLLSLKTDSSQRSSLIGNMDLDEWLINIASEQERDFLPETISVSGQKSVSSFKNTIKEEAVAGFRAVIPLSLLLIIVLTGFLREKLKYKDEIVLGIVFTLAGMTLLTSGIKLGLASPGGEVGAQLPRAFSSEEEFIDRIVINNFDKNLLFHSIAPDGTKKTYFNYTDNKKIRAVEFFEEDFDEESGKYMNT
ncbi:MAG TPA: DUF1538 domain-containing protein [Bacteroidales bacterium]|nr:DUF1538 domain-containing protein [Bacteroidales bacterium]